MCHVNKQYPAGKAQEWFGEELLALYWIGPGWIRNDTYGRSIVMECTHSDKSKHQFTLAPGDVLHTTEDDIRIQIVHVLRKEEK